MPLRVDKDITKLLEAARAGDDVNLEGVVIPRIGGGLISKQAGNSLVRNFKLSDGSEDRDRDTIDPSGWDLEDFQRNGAILWAHNNWEPPIAIPGETGPKGDALYGDAEFIEDYYFSLMLLRLIDVGALKNCSVGFSAVEWVYNEDRRGIDFKRQKLIEWSVVPVGSNVNAMIQAGKSIDLSPMLEWSQRWLDNDPRIGKALADEEEMAVVVKALSPFAKTIDPGLPPKQSELPLGDKEKIDIVVNMPDSKKAWEALRSWQYKSSDSGDDPADVTDAKGGEVDVVKDGRVLSAKNVERLSKAYELLGEVLQAAQPAEGDDEDEDEEEACDDEEDKTTAELTTKTLDDLIEQAEGDLADALKRAREIFDPETVEITRDELKLIISESVKQLATPEDEPVSIDEIEGMIRESVSEMKEDLLRRTGRLPR